MLRFTTDSLSVDRPAIFILQKSLAAEWAILNDSRNSCQPKSPLATNAVIRGDPPTERRGDAVPPFA